MRRLPILPTLVVAAAIAAMIALGLWQLRRAEWKEALLARYAANAHLPETRFTGSPDEALLYRHARATCVPPVDWSARAGQSSTGESGWRHVALCKGGLAFDMGWSRGLESPKAWPGGEVAGVIDADRDHGALLVAATPAIGLAASARPDPAGIPNNHRGYAGQWFLFAGMAALIYGLAVRRKLARGGRDG